MLPRTTSMISKILEQGRSRWFDHKWSNVKRNNWKFKRTNLLLLLDSTQLGAVKKTWRSWQQQSEH